MEQHRLPTDQNENEIDNQINLYGNQNNQDMLMGIGKSEVKSQKELVARPSKIKLKVLKRLKFSKHQKQNQKVKNKIEQNIYLRKEEQSQVKNEFQQYLDQENQNFSFRQYDQTLDQSLSDLQEKQDPTIADKRNE